MATLRSTSRKPPPYSPREQITTTEYTFSLKTLDGKDMCPTITVTTPDTRGNRELRRQTKRMGRKDSTDSRGRDLLPLPSRGLTATQRQRDVRHVRMLRDRPSYVQRLSQSQPPPGGRSTTEDEGQAGKGGRAKQERASSMPPEIEAGVEESPRSFELPIRPARISAGTSLSDEMAKPSSQPSSQVQGSGSVERGRRTAIGPRTRRDSSSDSDSWKRRGRSRGPRPKPREKAVPQVEVEYEEGPMDGDQQGLEDGQTNEDDCTEGAENGESREEATTKRWAGWVPATEPESEK